MFILYLYISFFCNSFLIITFRSFHLFPMKRRQTLGPALTAMKKPKLARSSASVPPRGLQPVGEIVSPKGKSLQNVSVNMNEDELKNTKPILSLKEEPQYPLSPSTLEPL